MFTFQIWYNFTNYLLSKLDWARSPNRIDDYTYYEFIINKRELLQLDDWEEYLSTDQMQRLRERRERLCIQEDLIRKAVYEWEDYPQQIFLIQMYMDMATELCGYEQKMEHMSDPTVFNAMLEANLFPLGEVGIFLICRTIRLYEPDILMSAGSIRIPNNKLPKDDEEIKHKIISHIIKKAKEVGIKLGN